MNIITERDRIRTVADRWAARYSSPLDLERAEIGRRLAALDPETATADDVAAIIGNRSWTDIECDFCCQGVTRAIELNVETAFYGGAVRICTACLKKATTLEAGR